MYGYWVTTQPTLLFSLTIHHFKHHSRENDSRTINLPHSRSHPTRYGVPFEHFTYTVQQGVWNWTHPPSDSSTSGPSPRTHPYPPTTSLRTGLRPPRFLPRFGSRPRILQNVPAPHIPDPLPSVSLRPTPRYTTHPTESTLTGPYPIFTGTRERTNFLHKTRDSQNQCVSWYFTKGRNLPFFGYLSTFSIKERSPSLISNLSHTTPESLWVYIHSATQEKRETATPRHLYCDRSIEPVLV